VKVATAQPIGVRAIATTVGERELTAAVLAAAYRTTEAVIRMSLGPARVYVSERPPAELAAEVATRCLRMADAANRVDLLVWCEVPGADEGDAQRLGLAPRTTTVAAAGCSKTLVGIARAQAAIQNGEAERVLVLCAEVWRFPKDRRSFGDVTEKRYQDLFSDGASAILVERTDVVKLCGFASAQDPVVSHFYDQYDPGRPQSDEDVFREMVALRESTNLTIRAFTQALEDAGLQRSDLHHVILPQEAAPLRPFLMRILNLPADLLIEDAAAVAHLGSSDPILALERASARGLIERGQRIALVGRAVGSAAVLVIEA
jgi:3-oxoacyl-[acyl-carrier-protein] synthase III